jgi:hypothetical protein
MAQHVRVCLNVQFRQDACFLHHVLQGIRTQRPAAFRLEYIEPGDLLAQLAEILQLIAVQAVGGVLLPLTRATCRTPASRSTCDHRIPVASLARRPCRYGRPVGGNGAGLASAPSDLVEARCHRNCDPRSLCSRPA